MSYEMPKCKITIIKRTLNKDLINEFLDDNSKDISRCDWFKDGQEIEIDPNLSDVPENFCAWAWADIRKEILTVASGGNIPGMKQRGTVITSCTDWFRHVIFKVERID